MSSSEDSVGDGEERAESRLEEQVGKKMLTFGDRTDGICRQ